jgi:hypothetical protein
MMTNQGKIDVKISLSEQIKFLMEHHPKDINALLYGEIAFTVRDGKLKVCKVLHTIDVEKLQEGGSDGNAKDQQG